MMANVWRVLFSGDEAGHLNNILMNVLGVVDNPIQFLQDADILFPIMIVVSLWSSMGLGFLAMLAGVLNIDRSLYEAAAIDGMRNRWQEIFYITIPSIKPQMLFGAVMAIIGTFNSAGLASALAGGTAPPQYAGWLIVDEAGGRCCNGTGSALSLRSHSIITASATVFDALKDVVALPK